MWGVKRKKKAVKCVVSEPFLPCNFQRTLATRTWVFATRMTRTSGTGCPARPRVEREEEEGGDEDEEVVVEEVVEEVVWR